MGIFCLVLLLLVLFFLVRERGEGKVESDVLAGLITEVPTALACS